MGTDAMPPADREAEAEAVVVRVVVCPKSLQVRGNDDPADCCPCGSAWIAHPAFLADPVDAAHLKLGRAAYEVGPFFGARAKLTEEQLTFNTAIAEVQDAHVSAAVRAVEEGNDE